MWRPLLWMGLGMAGLMGAASAMATEAPPTLPGGASLAPLAFTDIPGWRQDSHDEAFAAFRRSCATPPPLRAAAAAPPALALACSAALALRDVGAEAARQYFERWFQPFRIQADGFLTGYYEPEFEGSLVPSPAFATPLHGRPADLVTAEQGAGFPGLPPDLSAARRNPDGSLTAYPTRREIDETDVAKDWPVVAWLRDPVDRFIMQVQGSARLRLAEGGTARIAYAGRNGHPYTSLGRVLSQAEAIPPAEMTMDRLVARLKADAEWGRRFIWNNRSYVFFRLAAELEPGQGPIGGAGVPLTAHRSAAADRSLWAYGLPLWLDGVVPTPDRAVRKPLQRLTIIQDTGSAIVGPARFDLFHGSGDEAGLVAGLSRHPVAATILWPRRGPL